MSRKELEKSSQWIVQETTCLDELTIAEGASITAAEGYSVTMTVDGVNKPIVPGKYQGKVILNVTENLLISSNVFKTAVYVENGKVVPEKSVLAFAVGGEVTDTYAKNITLTSEEEAVNGIYITGDCEYSVDNATITMTGNGGNDFVGCGAGILANGNAKVTVNKAKIKTQGAVRTAIFAGEHSTLTVNDSSIEVLDGKLPEDYTFTIEPGKMKEVPWMLGLSGNCRATNAVAYSTVRYNNTHIKAQKWGCLSTDAVDCCRLYATNCLIETVESGYGAYTIADCQGYFSGCTFNINDYALVIASESYGTFTDGCVVNSGRFGVMIHGGTGGGALTLNKGSVFNTKSAVIQVKERGGNIVVDGAELNSESGIILLAMESDDPILRAIARGEGLPPGFPVPPDKDGAEGEINEAWTTGKTEDAPKKEPAVFSTNLEASFKNVNLKGDFINSMTKRGDVILSFENATITGAITTGISDPIDSAPTQETYYMIGEVKNTYCSTDEEYGIKVSLDEKSTWIVDKSSYLNRITVATGASVKAADGKMLTMTVNGTPTSIKAGDTYEGKIVLMVK
ncbi:MAG: hypothetical protein H6Q73_3912 [Firmicutes bacterium]|nr:hypothetical protein [Bacillota bacterium]